MINALRQVFKEDGDRWAKEDETECTTSLGKYPYEVDGEVIVRDGKQVMLWDIPGMGTKNQRKENYVQDNCLTEFDLLVVLYSQAIDTDLQNIIRSLHEDFQVPVIIGRSKVDVDIQSILRRERAVTPKVRDHLEKLRTVGAEEVGISGLPVLLLSSPVMTGDVDLRGLTLDNEELIRLLKLDCETESGIDCQFD